MRDEFRQLSAAILRELDQAAERIDFPMWDNGYVAPAGGRLSLFGDGKQWAIVVEAIGWFHRASAYAAFENAVYRFGSDFSPELNGDVPERYQSLCVVSEFPGHPLWDADRELKLDASYVCPRDTPAWITTDPDLYSRAGIPLFDQRKVSDPDLLRWMVQRYRSFFVASPPELRRGMSRQLPLLLQLDDWHHPDIAAGQLPSDTETFVAAADAVASGDPSFFDVSETPNTDWRNWPEGGTL